MVGSACAVGYSTRVLRAIFVLVRWDDLPQSPKLFAGAGERVSGGGEFFQQRFAFAKPRTLASLHVAGERSFFCEQFIRPFARFFAAVGGFQKTGVVVKRFGGGGDLCNFGKEQFRAVQLPGARVGISEQARGAVVIK